MTTQERLMAAQERLVSLEDLNDLPESGSLAIHERLINLLVKQQFRLEAAEYRLKQLELTLNRLNP